MPGYGWLCLVSDLWYIFFFQNSKWTTLFCSLCWLFLSMLCYFSRLRRTSANLPRRVWHLLKLVLYFVIPMELLRSRVSRGARSCVFWRRMVCFPRLLLLPITLGHKFRSDVQLICCFWNWLGLAPEIPEDLYHLIKKAVAIRKHLERNRKDKDSKFRLILVESRIHRLARYYKTTKKLPPVWK